MEKSAKSSALNYGLYLGLGLALLTIIIWAVNMNLFIEWWFGFLILFAIVITGVVSISKAKKLQGGYISFLDALGAYMFTIVIGTLISTIISVVIFNFVDPDGAATLNEEIMVVTKQRLEAFNVPPDAIKEQMAKMEGQNQFSMSTYAKNYVIGLAIYLVIGLIASLIMKKNNPDAA